MMQAIRKTLAYASIFNYPLTKEEIHLWLIGKKISSKEMGKIKLPEQNFSERRKKEKNSIKKWIIAKRISGVLQKIPTILCILITGNLAMNNSDEEDDIDLLIITQTNTVWTTRFFAVLLTDILKIRRHPRDKEFKDKICLNMFLDENHLKIQDENLYTAHELLQAKPIFDRNNIYQKFILANPWSSEYLPNAFEKAKNYGAAHKIFRAQSCERSERVSTAKFCCEPIIFKAFSFFEPFFTLLQKHYMSKKITTEKISDGQILFHPKNTQQQVLKKYKENLDKI